MPEEADPGLQIDGLAGGGNGPDGNDAVSAGCDEGFAVDEGDAGDLGLVEVLEEAKELE